MLKKLIYFFIVTLFCNEAFSQQNLVLVKNAKSDYKIVIPADANDIEKKAGAVLQDYIQKISNCKIEIVQQKSAAFSKQIIIGRNNLISQKDINSLGDDGLIIKKINNSLILAGGVRKGVLYSVYTFLEDYLGCKMYTAKAVYLPQKSTISLPALINRKEIPSFDYRTTFYVESLDHNYSDFHKMNYFFEDWGLFAHTFENLVPRAKYFQTHPEYYALVNGKRNPDQLCVTNPQVLNLVIQNLAQMIKEKPEAKYWSVSQNDNQNYCQCENCKRLDDEQGSHQGSILTFVNNVATHFPNKLISTLAYLYSEAPPKTLKPLSNVIIMLCTSDEERRVPLNKQPNSPFKDHFQKWSAITSKLFLWDYIVQFTNSLSPFPNLYTLQPNIQYFNSKNVTYLFEQGIGEIPAEFSELRSYLISRLMWNTNVNVKATMQEFIDGYYGKTGGAYINQYINQITNNATAKNALLRSGWGPANNSNTYLSPENIKSYKSIFLAGLKATEGTVYNARIMKEYLPVLYAELEINKTKVLANNNLTFDKEADTELLNDFYAKMKNLNIIYLNEARLKVDDYYRSYNNLLGTMKQ